MARRPAFPILVAISLALGLGANSAIFSVIDGMWFRPPGVAHASNLVRIFSVTADEHEGMLSYPEYQDFKAQVPALRDVVAVGGRGLNLVEGNRHQLVTLNLVSNNFFTALGIQAAMGRLFDPTDPARDAQSVVLGNAFWKRHYGGDPGIVGQQIHVLRAHDMLVTVIGVLPPNFREVDTGSDRDLWFSEPAWRQLGDPDELHMRRGRWFRVLGLLAPHMTVAKANAQIRTAAQRLAAAYPQSNDNRSAVAVADLRYRLDAAGTNGLALLAIVLLVVVISSVNVSNLLLSRGAGRSTEMAIRLSMGANRKRLIRQLMTENLVLGVFGTALGLALGSVIIHALPSIIVAPPGFLNSLDFKFDDRVLLFTLAISFATVVLFGAIPALRSSRTELIAALKGAATSLGGSRRWPLRNWLALTQVAMSLTLLACAGVVVQSFVKTRSGDLGFARKQLLLVWIASDANPEVYRSVITRLHQLPGVRSVAAAVRAPLSLSSNGMSRLVRLPNQPASTAPYEIKYNSVSANFLSTMGTPVLRGRSFDATDETGITSNSVLVNEQMAERFWPNEDAVGKTILIGGDHPKPYRVVGVAKNAPINEIGEAPESYLYLPYWSNFEQEVTFIIETDENAAALTDTARKTLKSVDGHLDPLTVVTENDLIRYSAQRYQLTAFLVGTLGLIGLLLTVVGVYGVVSYGVSLRIREFGIRMALGADRAATLSQVLREVSIVALCGTAIGLPLALLATRSMQSLLFGIGPWNVTAFAVSWALLWASLLFAGFLPARRAMKVEPAEALRTM